MTDGEVKICVKPPNDTRRGPFFKTKLCPWFPEGRCRMADECNWAHSEAEMQQPNGYNAEDGGGSTFQLCDEESSTSGQKSSGTSSSSRVSTELRPSLLLKPPPSNNEARLSPPRRNNNSRNSRSASPCMPSKVNKSAARPRASPRGRQGRRSPKDGYFRPTSELNDNIVQRLQCIEAELLQMEDIIRNIRRQLSQLRQDVQKTHICQVNAAPNETATTSGVTSLQSHGGWSISPAADTLLASYGESSSEFVANQLLHDLSVGSMSSCLDGTATNTPGLLPRTREPTTDVWEAWGRSQREPMPAPQMLPNSFPA